MPTKNTVKKVYRLARYYYSMIALKFSQNYILQLSNISFLMLIEI